MKHTEELLKIDTVTDTAAGNTTYLFQNDKGDAKITVHTVFPGVELIYNSVHTDRFHLGSKTEGHLIEIHHCREGRIEQQLEDEFFYLMPGDLSVSMRSRRAEEYRFPLRHYHGISIVINTEESPKCFSCFLKDVNVQPEQVAKRLCGGGKSFVIRSQDYIGHIFSELYTVPESYKKGYFKIKILELLLVLSGIDPKENGVASLSLSKMQVYLAKKTEAYLSANMGQKITVAELSKKFHVSQTHLQNAFRGVYGVPVFSYIRIQKMQAAALQLIHTPLTVMEIAAGCGYDNASKFASAFREIMGETPAEYRKMHSQIKK